MNVVNNQAEERYEAAIGDAVAFSQYQLEGASIVFLHTEVPEELEGRGIGTAIAKAALVDARERGLTVVPLCPFISAYIARNPEYLSIVEERYRARLQRTQT